jgi:EmrB/QacA subfamily drug resistance transporter
MSDQAAAPQSGAPNKRLVLVAMIFAVSMMFIDQTIVALAIPDLQKDLSLSSTGAQWIVNGYLLSLAALFALGGKLSDVLGHRRMVIIGVTGFAVCSALCGATPTGSIGETWMIVFRVLQGAFAALMFPAALGIVVSAFPLAERGRALAAFFGITGALTAVGPLAGGYLTEWTWRAIFWINIPVAIIALILTFKAKPAETRQPAPIDYRAAVLISAGMGFVVLGLQQAGVWGWTDPKTIGSIVVGIVLLVLFVTSELRQREPLIRVRLFEDRGFFVDNAVLLLMSAVFVPFFFFASVYAQAALGYSATRRRARACSCSSSSAASRPRRSGAGGSSTSAAHARPSSSAAPCRRSVSTSGAGSSPIWISAASGTGSSSQAPGSASCWVPSAPTR